MDSPQIGITLDEFVILKEKDFPHASGDLSKLLRDIGLAAKLINREVRKAGLVDILGAVGQNNVQGEEVQKLDVYANNKLISFLENGGQCCGVATEELEEYVAFDEHKTRNARYVVCMDPLDGSSNIDVNVTIGTVFSIYRRLTEEGPCKSRDFLQKGEHQVASGYIVYGSSTMLVYSTGFGVHGFTLDPSFGEFCLSHPQLEIPEMGSSYSVNEGNFESFAPATQAYIKWCRSSQEGKKNYSLRYIGSMVADFHRTLIKGGIFMYPGTKEKPLGKLRLLYECNPIAYLAEQAGGKASSGSRRILEIQPTELHQRVPFMVGSSKMVEEAEAFIKAEKDALLPG